MRDTFRAAVPAVIAIWGALVVFWAAAAVNGMRSLAVLALLTGRVP